MTEARSETHTRLGVVALLALPVCCIGLSLLAGGLGLAAVVWIGGFTLGAAALAAAVFVVARALRKTSAEGWTVERKEQI